MRSADFRLPIFDCQLPPDGRRLTISQRRAISFAVLGLLPLVIAAGETTAWAQSSSARHASANDKWRNEWRKRWLAEHGQAAPTAKAPAEKTTLPDASPPKLTSPASSPVEVSSSAPKAAATKPAPALPTAMPTASSSDKKPAPQMQAIKPVAVTPPAKPAPTESRTPKVEAPPALAQTKPDVFTAKDPALGSTASGDHTQDSPMASAGDSWKMIAYLLPVLLGIIGCLNLLKRFQARTGRLPGVFQSASPAATGAQGKPRSSSLRVSGGIWNALVGGFHLNNARQAGGSSIRLLESVPIGGANVHLLEVRGRVLLLGASAAGLSLLAEFEERGGASSNDFRDLLHAAAADMDALDYAEEDLPATATVSTLEDLMRETGQNVRNNARRLRTVREVEIDE